MRKDFQAKIKTFLIVVLVAVVISVGGILLWKQSRQVAEQPTAQQTSPPAPSPQPKVIDTSGWQTYRNEEFGFEVRYPEDWSIIAEISGQPAFFSPDGKVKIYTRVHISGTPEYIYSLAYKEEQECPERIFKSGEPVVAPGAACPLVKPLETREIHINGINGYFKKRESGSFSAYLPRPDKKIAIELFAQHSDYREIFDQILSTFRFIDQKPEIPKDKQTCESRGGTWGRFGLAQVELCNLPTSDGGKTCTDSSQCESVCVTNDNILPDTDTTGKCYGWTETLGTCLNHVNNGKAQGTLCAD